MSTIGMWRTAILTALCGSSRIVPSQHFAQELGRPLTKTESGALHRAIHSLKEQGSVVVGFTSTGEGKPRRLMVRAPEEGPGAGRVETYRQVEYRLFEDTVTQA
jgi:hypothetical protein